MEYVTSSFINQNPQRFGLLEQKEDFDDFKEKLCKDFFLSHELLKREK